MARLTDTRVAAISRAASGQEEHPDELVTGLRLRVGTTGRKTWIVRTRAGGKPLNKTLGTFPTLNVATARDLAKAFLIEIAKRGFPPQKHTFGELADLWIERVAKPKNKSWRLQKRRLEIHVLPRWRDRDIAQIRRTEVRELVEAVEGKVAANRVLTLIKTVFRFGLSRDWIEASPAEAIEKPRQEAPRDRFLDIAEARRVYKAADLLGYPFGGFIKLLLLTAQRRSEVAGMRWGPDRPARRPVDAGSRRSEIRTQALGPTWACGGGDSSRDTQTGRVCLDRQWSHAYFGVYEGKVAFGSIHCGGRICSQALDAT